MIRRASNRHKAPETNEGSESVTLYYHAAKGRSTPYCQGTADITSRGFEDNVFWLTDDSGREMRKQGVGLWGSVQGGGDLVPNVEVTLSVTEEESEQWADRPLDLSRPPRADDFRLHEKLPPARWWGGWIIPADVVNSRARIRVLTPTEGARAWKEQLAADARAWKQANAREENAR